MEEIKKIMGENFIGPEELKKIKSKLGIGNFSMAVPIPFDFNELKRVSKDYILILGAPTTINKLRLVLGCDCQKSEPCFYNQDWYLKEHFAENKTLESKWYLIRKYVNEDSRGQDPEKIVRSFKKGESFPFAILTAFVFFAYYFLTDGEILWKHDFIWCSDKDHNGDRIYTGRYIDPQGVNKKGFNVHRHLSIRSCYGLAPQRKMG